MLNQSIVDFFARRFLLSLLRFKNINQTVNELKNIITQLLNGLFGSSLFSSFLNILKALTDTTLDQQMTNIFSMLLDYLKNNALKDADKEILHFAKDNGPFAIPALVYTSAKIVVEDKDEKDPVKRNVSRQLIIILPEMVNEYLPDEHINIYNNVVTQAHHLNHLSLLAFFNRLSQHINNNLHGQPLNEVIRQFVGSLLLATSMQALVNAQHLNQAPQQELHL